jgi:hypothetical protein
MVLRSGCPLLHIITLANALSSPGTARNNDSLCLAAVDNEPTWPPIRNWQVVMHQIKFKFKSVGSGQLRVNIS